MASNSTHEQNVPLIVDKEIVTLLNMFLNCESAKRRGSSNSRRESATDPSLTLPKVRANLPPPARFLRRNNTAARPPPGPVNLFVDHSVEPCSVQSSTSSASSIESRHAYDIILESLMQPDYSERNEFNSLQVPALCDLNNNID